MRLVLWSLRHNRTGIVGQALLLLVLVGAVAAGTVMLFQSDTLKVEGRLYDVGYGQDPMPAKFDVVLTNNGSSELRVDHVTLRVYADPGREILLTESDVRGVHVAPRTTETVTVDLLIYNGASFGAHVWVDADLVWYEGTQRHNWQGTREFSVSDVLSGLK